jgi:HD-like signal output (HDOD) protein
MSYAGSHDPKAGSGAGSVLFVDDDSPTMTALHHNLTTILAGWELLFASSGAAALECLEGREVDVVVSELNLPDMTGAQLLTAVQHRRPGAARLILSGETDSRRLIAGTQVAQQVISKPCDAQTLALAVRRVIAVRRSLHDPRLRELMGSVNRLPALPDVYQRIVDEAGKPDSQIKDIAKIVASDMATAAELLKLVNSALFVLPRAVVSVEQAVTLLGLQSVTSLVLAGSIFRTHGLPAGLDGEHLRQVAIHSCEVARAVAKTEGWPPHEAGQVALAAMLRDAGMLILAEGSPEAIEELDLTLTDPIERAEQERRVFGCTVPAASAYLLGIWGFPQIVVHAVASQPLIPDEPGSTAFEQILSYAYHRTLAGPDVTPQIPKLDPHRRERWSTAADAVLGLDEAPALAPEPAPEPEPIPAQHPPIGMRPSEWLASRLK